MKLFLILLSVVVSCFFGWRAFNHMIFPPSVQPHKVAVASPAAGIDPITGVAPTRFPDLPNAPSPGFHGNNNGPIGTIKAVAVYIFKNRPVPPAPFGRGASTLGTAPDSSGLELSVDTGSNSWIMRGPPDQVDQTNKIAEFVDVVQTELDLDFLLISVSEEWLRTMGISASYSEGASWLSTFSLGGDGSSLRLESGGLAVDVGYGDSTQSVRLLSSPVVRCITGEPWEFSADQQVPIETLIRSEGVVSTGYEYRNVGLGFKGLVQKAGPKDSFRLVIDQRNGSTDSVATGKDPATPPALLSQNLSSALVVEIGRWSCVGGVSSWKVTEKKRILGMTREEEQDLLLVFVRPRDSLQVAPRAFPIGSRPDHLTNWGADPMDLPPGSNPLLPPKPGNPGALARPMSFPEWKRATGGMSKAAVAK